VIERDNRTGDWAGLKTLARVRERDFWNGVSHAEKAPYDLLPAMLDNNGWISDKPEGFAVTGNGRAFVVSDNDGVEDWSGETWFLELPDFGRRANGHHDDWRYDIRDYGDRRPW
jgi:hypothetical protein